MCGIFGCTGRDDLGEVLVEGLATLEYRGYDSAGVAVVGGSRAAPELRLVKRAGKLSALRSAVDGQDLSGTAGLGHTRWATHGPPTDRNAHPHVGGDGRLAIVHNGILENHEALRAELAGGVELASDTDSELLAHLVAVERDALAREAADVAAGAPQSATVGASVLGEATRRALGRCEGQFALAVIDARDPATIVAARRGAPLILGHGDTASWLASDVAGLIRHTRDVEALMDDQLAVLTPESVAVCDLGGNPTQGHRYTVDWDVEAAEKQGYPHFMLKEINEQPAAVRETLLDRFDEHGRLRLDEEWVGDGELRRIDKVYVVACGTSYHAGMVGRYAIEHWARLGVDVEIASEFRYRDPILNPHTLVVAISQSGETTDTMAAAAHARDQRAPVLAVTNVVGSTLARAADGVLYTRAGPEIGVAATKTFLTQVVAVDLLALYLAQERRTLLAEELGDAFVRLEGLPELLDRVLATGDQIAELAAGLAHRDYFMFIARHAGLPIALEGALKLKEISYTHAEGFPAGEMKHGPIALIDDGGPVIALATRSHVRAKLLSSIAEVRARGAVVVAVATEGDTEITAHADHVVYVPDVHELLAPVLSVVPTQLFAYHVATQLGRDVDQPRNLAKTVTVE
jgi:glucosamine--fructose-6-phosphate aminotransferase (isomerizing)